MGGKRARRRQLISDRIALYKTEEDLGAWGAGQGRWVYDEQDKEHFVFVTIPPESLPNSRSRRAFKRQLEHSQGLEHPRIVAILKGGTDDGDGRPYLIQEPTSGRTLERAFAEKESFTPKGALQVAVDVLNGLAYAHSRGRLEGGLSPRSVLISGEGDLARGRILTFGFPRLVGEERETPVGKLYVDSEWAAPEVIKSEPVDARADVYSVGALLYRMLTGKPAIPVASSKEPVLHRLNQTAESLPEGTIEGAARDEAVRIALRLSLSKAPSRRPTARGFALLLAGQSDEGERFVEVLPDGGTCKATGAVIPPFAERPWDRKLSDRPFRCRTSGEHFAGQAQWDPRMLTSTKGADKGLPEPEGEPPIDVVLSRDAKTSSDRDTAARMRAMAELITSSKEQRPTRNVADDRDPKSRVGEEGRESDVVRTALIDAWEHDRRELKTARQRATQQSDGEETPATPAKRPSTRGEPAAKRPSARSARRESVAERPSARPEPDSAPPQPAKRTELLPPLGKRTEPKGEGRPATHTPTGWALITLGLLLFALFLGITLSGERSARLVAEQERDTAKTSLEQAGKAADTNAVEAGELRSQVTLLVGERDEHMQSVTDAVTARGLAEGANARLRSSLDAMTTQATTARTELEAAQLELAASIAMLHSAKLLEASLREELAVAKANAIAPAELKRLRGDVQRLEGLVTQAAQREAALTTQAQQAALELRDRDGAISAGAAREEVLTNEVTTLEEQLTRFRAERVRVEQELSELKLALSERSADPGSQSAGTKVALSVATLDAQGRAQAAVAGTPVALTPGSRVILRADLAQLTPLLRAGEAASAVLALHVRVTGSGKAPRAFGQALAEGGGLDPNRARRYHRAAAGGGDVLRYWVTPAEARRYLKEGRANAFVLEAAFGGEPREVLGAELVLTPVGGDAARLLKELRSKPW